MDLINESKPLLEELAAAVGEAEPSAVQAQAITDLLNKLQPIEATFELLSTTQIGKVVTKFQKVKNVSIAELSKSIVETWRQQVAAAAESKKRKRAELESSQGSQDGSQKSTTDSPSPAEKRAKLNSSSSSVTPSLTSSNSSLSNFVGSTKSDMRNTVQKRFFENLAKFPSQPGSLNPEDIAVAVEEALFALHKDERSKEYANQYRTLAMRFTDAKNQWLRDALFSGAMSAGDLVKMSPEELASPEEKEKARKMMEEIMGKKKIEQKKATSTAFTCKKCLQSMVHYFQLQTRSADEPMTTFIECINCGNSWKM